MGKERTLLDIDELQELQVPALGSELIRQVILPELLGEDNSFVQYYLGKTLARKFPLHTIDEIIAFFNKAGFGTLELIKEKKNEYIFHLSGDIINQRFQYKETPLYRLEAGFLAEQLSHIDQRSYECWDEPKKKHGLIFFRIIISL
jgi:predicted hydrocarbon binding protein